MINTIGYYSDTDSLGGSEVYLKALLDGIDFNRYQVKFFCPENHPLVSWVKAKERIQLVILNKMSGAVNSLEDQELLGSQPTDRQTRHAPTVKSQILKFFPPSLKLFIGILKDILWLKKIFKKEQVHLIHFNDTGCEPPVIAARLAGIKHIIGTYHVVPSYDKAKMDWVRRLIEWLSTRCLDQAISVSQATKKEWMARVGIRGENIRVIYNGIDLNKLREPAVARKENLRHELGITPQDNIVIVPARLHPMKGHRYLLEAVPEILKQIPDIKFLLVGDGDLRSELQNLANTLKISPHILFLGFRKDIYDLMYLSDMAVLPSVSLEALPFVLIEAMACGKPTVATNFSGIPEVVENGLTGVLVARHDSQALAKAIVKLLLDKKKAKQMGQRGRQRAEQIFTQEQMFKKTFQVYEQCFSRSSQNE